MKSVKTQANKKLITRASIFALFYCLLFNSSVFIYKYDHYKHSDHIIYLELFKDFIYIYVMLFFSFLGFSINNIIFRIYSLFLYATGALTSYYIYTIQILPTSLVVKSVFDVHFIEAFESINTKMVFWVIICIIFCHYLLKKFELKDGDQSYLSPIFLLLIILSVANIITPFYKIFTDYLPIQYLHNTYHYFIEKYTAKNLAYLSNLLLS